MSDNQRTRPSEAEVTEAMVEAAMTTFGFSSDPNPSRSAHWVKCAIRAALSTQPLPSAPERDCTCLGSCKGAQGLAAGWRCALSKGAPPLPSAEPVRDDDCGDGMTWADVREKVARALADAKKYELRVAFLRRTFAPLPSAEPKYAWVIVDSRYPAPDLRYYNGVGSNELGKGWTPNHMKAIRFCRNVDADAALMSLPHGWHLVGAVEQHGWSASTTPPLPSAEPVAGKPLLPCPFCGGEAEFEREGTGRQSCIVTCTYCGVRHESGDTFDSGSSWNRRTTPPAAAQEAPC